LRLHNGLVHDKDWFHQIAGARAPKPDLVSTNSHDLPAIRAEGRLLDCVPVPKWREQRLPGDAIPNPRCLVVTGRNDLAPIGTERN
jgi:hypothetical protein